MKITNKFIHHYSDLANSTVSWLGSDSKENFLERLKKEPTDPDVLYYKENPIEYKFNNYGFRTEVDFIPGMDGNIFLGCSHTVGIGHHLENTWSWKLNEEIGGNFLNLAVGGTGIGTAFRLLHAFKDMLKPTNVFLLNLHPYRYEYFDHYLHTWVSHRALDVNPILSRHLLEQNNRNLYYHLHLNAIHRLCDDLEIRLFNISYKNLLHIHEKSDYSGIPATARDNHMNISEHINLYECFKNSLSSNQEVYYEPLELDFFNKKFI